MATYPSEFTVCGSNNKVFFRAETALEASEGAKIVALQEIDANNTNTEDYEINIKIKVSFEKELTWKIK